MDGIEEKVTAERLHEATDTLMALGTAFERITMLEEKHENMRMQIRLMVSFTNMAAAEMAYHLVKGNEFHDALRATVRSELKIPSDVAAMFAQEIEDLHNPMKKN